MSQEPQTGATQPVTTSDPVALVALLYDKAVQSLNAAVRAIRANEVETRWRATHKAVEIINHLFMALDLEKGGQIASNLEALYAYMLRRLVDVDVRNDARAALEVIELLEPLRASWKELAKASGDIRVDDPLIDAMTGCALDEAAA